MEMVHFLHNHPLEELISEDVIHDEKRIACSGCQTEFLDSGPIYGCIECQFILHKSCLELPKQTQSFFHPCPLMLTIIPVDDQLFTKDCDACFEQCFGFRYRCQICDFDMHLECALQTPLKSEGKELQIQHFTHWHPLTLVDSKKEDIEACCCNICGKKLKLCSDSVYGCNDCNFFLHNSCMINIPRQINHLFHDSCPLILTTKKHYKCEGCDEERSGLSFSCGKCNFRLDLKCSLLPTIDSQDADLIQHFFHEHPLALFENKPGSVYKLYPCDVCSEPCLGPSFGCNKCNFHIHKPCAELPAEIYHPFHLGHKLIISSVDCEAAYTLVTCNSCGQEYKDYVVVYRCDGEKCDFTLDLQCAKLTPSFSSGCHPHPLTLFEKTSCDNNCINCAKKDQSFILRCLPCEFEIHLQCNPSIPTTIKHKSHLHPLTLTESPLEFELISPEYASAKAQHGGK